MLTGSNSKRGARRVWPRSFSDRLTAPLPRPADMVRIMREGGFRGSTVDADRIPVLRNGLAPVPTGTTALTWVGHATYLIRMGGACVLADPVWSDKIPGVPRRLTPPGVAWSELPKVDAVVISHNHYDHLDAPTIKRLPRNTPVLVPAGLGEWFTRRGFTDVTELDWWESAEVAGLRFDFVPAHHWSRRGVRDTCRSLWGGWVITDDPGFRVFHAGDTGYGHWFGEIGERYPDIDVAMLPIGAYAPRWFMKSVHMDPDEAVKALDDLGAQRLASMHWGTFVLTQEPVIEPLDRIREVWAARGKDQADLWDLAVGETRCL
ncbi:L-ascorbate metabolism protein UlaG (beta-lactamase superfamily) [Herbihabitans rhizosphaerae]|uniref:L-ascorbate metabolism protein UlaG (Beta-lactamase superfamily) n=1 Tax=Herbihabitans rhizosphaerae TaxID=1872711 RepID=A0A4Q7L3F1_9PSEU|nr:MBL fold metallo-hydrolase [Herbihabitans rhizosphaerae]RZS43704.1 L-ascorbate metabolism protein UlaG (beta-lactamase superfamily) [Herbihabitans rhizosphaerae]